MAMRVDEWDVHPQHFWLRGGQPETRVTYDEESARWNVYGYPEAVAVLTDPGTFSNNGGRISPVEIDPEISAGDFTQMDPPQHRTARGLVDQAFAPDLVAGLEPVVEAAIEEFVAGWADRDRLDLVPEFATPLPLTMICHLLGVPREDREHFHSWMRRIMGDAELEELPEDPGERDTAMRSAFDLLYEMRDYWNDLAEDRRRHPREDLMTRLVHVELDGEKLTGTEVFNIANRLLVAGHHSTSELIANTMLILDAFPDQAARVRADSSLLPGLIEESVRFLTPISGVGRVTNTKTEIAGTVIPEDQLVMVWIGAANRDARQFADPGAFLPDRAPNPHLGFGRGVHFCLGRRLARMEARAAVGALLHRFPALRTDPDQPPVFYRIASAGGVEKLPVLIR